MEAVCAERQDEVPTKPRRHSSEPALSIESWEAARGPSKSCRSSSVVTRRRQAPRRRWSKRTCVLASLSKAGKSVRRDGKLQAGGAARTEAPPGSDAAEYAAEAAFLLAEQNCKEVERLKIGGSGKSWKARSAFNKKCRKPSSSTTRC